MRPRKRVAAWYISFLLCHCGLTGNPNNGGNNPILVQIKAGVQLKAKRRV
jgi:hypothetical protein